MPARERVVDRGRRQAGLALVRLGLELREARVDRALSIDDVASALGISNAEVSRIERALSPKVPYVTLARFAAVVGLDLVCRMYPGPTPLRDAAQLELLGDFKAGLHRSVGWATEVPLPIRGDQRAWDAVISANGWSYGVEAETMPRDAQALVRRLQLKRRDGGVDGVILVLRDTRRTLDLVRAAADELSPMFPVPGFRAAELLRAGVDPGGSSLILVRRRPRDGSPGSPVARPYARRMKPTSSGRVRTA